MPEPFIQLQRALMRRQGGDRVMAQVLAAVPTAEAGCMAHASCKFHELWANHGSKVGQQVLRYFQVLFRLEEEVAGATTEERQRLRQGRSRRVAAALHRWLLEQRQRVPEGSATAKAID